MKNEIIDTIKLMIIIFLSIIIGIIISNKYFCCKIVNSDVYDEVIKNIKIDGINEGYEGQVVLKLDNNYYEYIYKSNDSQYVGEFK